jgi:3-hydroxyacyl-CoA dehydrogenase
MTDSPITTEIHDGILVIVSNNPPVNALGAAVRIGLDAGIKQAMTDDSVKAVVIRCDGRTSLSSPSRRSCRNCPKSST